MDVKEFGLSGNDMIELVELLGPGVADKIRDDELHSRDYCESGLLGVRFDETYNKKYRFTIYRVVGEVEVTKKEIERFEKESN